MERAVVRKLIKFVAVLYLSYLVLVVLLLLPALNTVPHWYIKQVFGRDLQTELVLFNPFTLSAELRGAAVPETDGTAFAAVQKARINLSLSSLWQPGWVFDEILVEELYLHVRQIEPGRFNFTDLLEAIPPSQPSPEEEQGLPGLTVHRLSFSADRISLTDEARETPFNTYYEGLDIVVTELSTIIEEGKPYQISAVAESGGKLNWTGTVSIPGSRSEGRLSLEQLSLVPFWRFAEPWLNFELQQAYLNLTGNYRIDWSEAFSYAIDDGTLAVRDIGLVAKSPVDLPDSGFSMTALTIDGIAIDSQKQHAGIASVRAESPIIAGWMDEETISLQQLFAVSFPDTAPEPAAEEPQAPWTASLEQLSLSDGKIQWRSPFTEPSQLLVSPLEANLARLNWPLEGESPLGLSFSINGQATLNVTGALALGPGDGTLQYQMEQLPLTWFNPNLPTALNGRLTDGHAELDGEITLAGFAPELIALSGAIKNFAAEIVGDEQSITSWKTLRLTDLLVKLDQRDVSLGQVIIDNYQGRVHIAEDGSVNANKVWQEEVGDRAEELVEELDLDEPWKYKLPEIYISDSAIDFMDESLPIPFRTVIGDIGGEILGIGSDPEDEAAIDIKGSVDGYAPVVLSGTAKPLGTPPALDLALTFNGVDLALLSPYSGTYAGYAIERGLLNLELEYALDNGQLEGDNTVVIRQLKLGEKVDSEQAVDLPLELALALLTDANGVIDLAVPVSGSVDDPEFGLGSAISKAFINLITKAVTAPFSLLANLVGAEDDLQRLNFASGSSELRETTVTKLDQLAIALQQRPNLTLIVLGRLNPAADTEYLQVSALREELLASGLSQEQIENKEQAFIDEIERRYRALGLAGELPSPPQQYNAVRSAVAVNNTALVELIEARAVAIKSYLVNEKGLAADRIAIEQTALDDEAHQFSGAELGLES
jgi:Domain of Unknown Function (DUF748)